MGATTVTRTAPASSEEELRLWFKGELKEMALESGTGPYCGNWNTNNGELRILSCAGILNENQAWDLLESKEVKRGFVSAARVGDFSKIFPESKSDKALVLKHAELVATIDQFDWHILDRAQKAKSKTKKCPHCESTINVHKMQKPKLPEFLKAAKGYWDVPYVCWVGGSRRLSLFRALTACPVCDKNLLKTETDQKTFASLLPRLADSEAKLKVAQNAYDEKNKHKPKPFWAVSALCSC